MGGSIEKKKGENVKKRRAKRSHARSSPPLDMLSAVHSVSIVGPRVIEFGDAPLREVFRVWWHPYDMGVDFNELTGQSTPVIRLSSPRGRVTLHQPAHPIVRGDELRRRELDPDYYARLDRVFRRIDRARGARRVVPQRRASARPAPVRVAIVLTYPLTETRRTVVTIDRRYPGEVFAHAHDFYRALYAEDGWRGGVAGPAPGSGMLNRGRGPLVWGHDLGDLSFEGCTYRKYPKQTAKEIGAEGEFRFQVGS
jgi:hypothetical protein